jgi:hypothetical protein
LDPNQSLRSQQGDQIPENCSDPLLKDDPKYQKYFKMLKMGLPKGAVLQAMQKDGVDESVLDLDPNQSLRSQQGDQIPENCSDPLLKDDSKYQKYFKMLKMGLPKGAVLHAMQKDGVHESVLDLDPNQSLRSQQGDQSAADGSDLLLKDDPKYQKYFKMLKMGLPKGAVQNALRKDGLDESIINMDQEKSLASQLENLIENKKAIPLKDDPAYQKYFKMLKMGLPDGAVRHSMEKDGIDSSILDLDPNQSLESQRTIKTETNDDVLLRDDPQLQKYFKMLQMGLPVGAVRNAMERDGVDPAILEHNPEKSLESQQTFKKGDICIPLKDDPEWSKYFKMLSMGIPLGAVKNAVFRDGKDPSILDLDHTKSIAEQRTSAVKTRQPPKKKPVRRKKIFWNPLDSDQIKANSLWSRVKGRLQMSQLKYDEKEFADLFTESADPTEKKKAKSGKEAKKVKKAVQVIDGKRSMNGGIILARLKIDYKKIADIVDNM